MITNFKIFENDINLELNRYVVWKMPSRAVILKLLSSDSKVSQFERLYIYNVDGDFFSSCTNDIFKFNNDDVKKRVIYTSDSLEKCLDKNMINALFSANKYNL